MRISNLALVTTAFVGALAALTWLAAPAQARSQDQRGASASEAPSSGCSSYVRAADGTWQQSPCQSIGAAPKPLRPLASDGRSASNRDASN